VSLSAYVARRLLQMIPIALGVTILVFLLMRLLPGDPALTILQNKATPARIALVRHDLGLDKSVFQQYVIFMRRLAHGNLGDSIVYDVPVRQLVVERLPPTLWLLFYGATLAMLISVPLAILAAVKRDKTTDHLIRIVPMPGLGFPAFWLGIMLLLIFGLHLGRLFPVGGYGTGPIGHLHSMFLPALTVALTLSPILIRSLRASMLEVLESDYITTARSKGLPERFVLRKHALPNAIIATVTVLGVNMAYLVGGTLVIEQVFAVPGVGQLMISSIFARDFPIVQGVSLVFAILVVLVYLVTDITHALLDPRVRFD
jgi:peptide/nickel transport system permease protein